MVHNILDQLDVRPADSSVWGVDSSGLALQHLQGAQPLVCCGCEKKVYTTCDHWHLRKQ